MGLCEGCKPDLRNFYIMVLSALGRAINPLEML